MTEKKSLSGGEAQEFQAMMAELTGSPGEAVANATEVPGAAEGAETGPEGGPPETAEGAPAPAGEDAAQLGGDDSPAPGGDGSPTGEEQAAEGAAEDDAGGEGETEAGEPEGEGDQPKPTQRTAASLIAEAKRKLKQAAKREKELEEKYSSRLSEAEARAKQAEQEASEWGRRFKDWDRSPYSAFKAFVENRGYDWNDVIYQLNKQHVGKGDAQIRRQEPEQPKTPPELDEVKRTLQQFQLQQEGQTYERRVLHSLDEYTLPNLSTAKKADVLEVAMERAWQYRQQNGAFPSEEELLVAIDDEVGYQRWKQSQSARPSPGNGAGSPAESPRPQTTGAAPNGSSPARPSETQSISQADVAERPANRPRYATEEEELQALYRDANAGRLAGPL